LGAGIIVMHKIFSRANLLAATALTSVALFGGQQVLAQGKAAKIKLGLSGGMTSLLGFGTQKSSFEKSSNADVSGVTHYEQFNIIMDTEIHVSGSIRLDNGMTVSVVAEFEADQFTANGASGQGDKGIDDSYMSLDGGFGQIRIGSTSPGSHDFANTAPVIGALSHDNGDTDNWVVVPAASGLGSPGSDISDGNVMKIVYVTPSMAGFILGGSYEPGAATSELVAASGGNSGTETQSFDVGLGYAAKLGKANISADIQYQRVVGPAASSIRALRGGMNISAGAFTIGGGYRQVRDTDSGVSGTANSSDQDTWDIGVTYSGSGWAIGLTALGSEMPLTSAAPGDDEVTKLLFGVSYGMGPGIDLLGTIAYVDWQDEATNASNNNVGYAVVGGVSVSF
jgi:outer membrane protein OmpU